MFVGLVAAGGTRVFLPAAATDSCVYSGTFADVTADGLLDVVVLSHSHHRVTTLRGTPSGRFRFAARSTDWAYEYHFAIGDLNNDGAKDLVFPFPTIGLGNGAGGFPVSVEFPMTPRTSGYAVTDLNADGLSDLIGIWEYSDTDHPYYYVLGGNAWGGLGPQEDYATGYKPNSIAVTDMDADGRDDIVVTCGKPLSPADENTVCVHYEAGTVVAPVVHQAVTCRVSGVRTLNVDGVAGTDLAVLGRPSGLESDERLVVVHGPLPSPQVMHNEWRVPEPQALAVGDIDGDALDDIAVCYGRNVGHVGVLFGAPGGVASELITMWAPRFPDGVAIAPRRAGMAARVAVYSTYADSLCILGRVVRDWR